jgi:hypothetical protein
MLVGKNTNQLLINFGLKRGNDQEYIDMLPFGKLQFLCPSAAVTGYDLFNCHQIDKVDQSW